MGANDGGAAMAGAAMVGAAGAGAVMARIVRTERGRWTARRQASFLAALGTCGNVRLACATARVSSTAAYHRRRRDGGFARDWAAALARAEAALDVEPGDRDGLAARRNCRGVLQLRTVRVNDWTEQDDATFLEALQASANVTKAADATGKHVSRAYVRRRNCPAFRAAWDATLEEAIARLEWLLMARATERMEPPAPPGEAIAAPDTGLALATLKYHAARQGRRRGGRAPIEPRIEDVRDNIARKLAALRRHRGD